MKSFILLLLLVTFNSTAAARDYGNQLEMRLNSDNQVKEMFTVTSVISQD